MLISIYPVVRELIELAVKLHRPPELLVESNVREFVDVSWATAHSFEVVSRIQYEVYLLSLEETNHIIKQLWLELLVSDVGIGEIAVLE